MNVKQALKLKNKLIEELNGLYEVARLNNSIEVGNVRHFSVEASLDEAKTKAAELAELKSKIHVANAPVYGKIFLLSEYKNYVKELRAISTEEGKVYGHYSSVAQMKEVELNAKDIKERITLLEDEIGTLQDELDMHNLTAEI